MTANELFSIEHGNQNEIHLFLAGHFWQAWEKSAYYFTKHFESYEVHGKFIKKISAEMVYLGFSKEALENVRKKCSRQNFTITQVDEKHLIISGFTPYSGFEQWKRDVYENSLKKKNEQKCCEQQNIFDATQTPPEISDALHIPEKSILYASKEFYECTKYIFTRTGETSKLYRYGLGDKLRAECLDLLDLLHCAQMKSMSFDGAKVFELFCRVRVKLRLLLDFRQVSEKQWFYINERLDEIKKVLRLESFGLRFKGAG